MSEKEKISWSDTQMKIIGSKNENVLVSAGAGAGKTAVLVEKIVRRVADEANPLNVDEILVVTFTEKAALEMKERISKSLTEKLINDPSNKRIKAQLQLINKANISTIHSFCNELLRKYFYMLELDPDFGIAGDQEVELIKDEVLEGYLEEMYEKESDNETSKEVNSDTFFRLVDYYGGSLDDSNLKQMILSLHEFSRSHPDPEKWLNDVGEYFSMEGVSSLSDSKYFEDIVEILEEKVEKIIKALERAIDRANLPGGPYQYYERLEEELTTACGLKEKLNDNDTKNWDKLRSICQGFRFKRLPSIKKDDPVDDELKEEVKNLRDKAKDEIKSLKDSFFSRQEDEMIEELKAVAPYMKLLTDMVFEFDRRYMEVKKQRKLLDYSDLEHKTLLLLEFEEIVRELKEKYKEVMVDEYQDINGVQNEILEVISDSTVNDYPYMFMVGDVKQSIYRFRLAEPGLFLNKYYKYSDYDNQENDLDFPGRLIELKQNFRSSKKVIDGVNNIFENIMTRKIGGVDYDENTRLDSGKTFPKPEQDQGQKILLDKPVEVHFVQKDQERQLTDEEQEAKLIAKRIKELIDSGYCVYEKDIDEYRPLEYRDVVVLNRQLGSHGERITEIFAEEEVPFYAELNKGYFKSPEIQVMLSLLKVIDNPRQDIPLAAVLRSPIFNFTEEELFEIRGRGDLYEDLINVSGVSNDFSENANENEKENVVQEKVKIGLVSKINEFLTKLNRWRSFSRKNKLSELIWDIFEITGYLDFVRGLKDGEERKANLHSLYDLALQFDTFSQSGLFRFLRFIEKLEDRDEDLAKARVLSEKENVVRLMSIHKSKGLEFRVVFVMGLGKSFNMNEIKKDLLYHKELGLGPKIVDLDKRLKYPTISYEVIKERIRKEVLAEEMRILYVALTRAEEHLILVGSGKEIDGHEEPDNIGCYFDWIIPSISYDVNDEGHGEGHNKRYFELQVHEEIQDEKTQDDQNQYEKSEGYGEIAVGRETEDVDDYEEEPSDIVDEIDDLEAIRSALNWKYPYQHVTQLPAKLTVTQIQQEAKEIRESRKTNETSKHLAETFLKRPEFLKEKEKLTGAELGTAYHLVFQHVPLDLAYNAFGEHLSESLDKLIEKEIITKEQIEMIEPGKVESFFETELGKRVLQNKDNLTREINFTLGVSYKDIEIYEEMEETDNNCEEKDEIIVIQGAVDYLIEEKDGFLLIDFKTDNIKENELKRLQKDYKVQLDYYKMAVEKIYNKEVKETYIYHIMLEKAIRVD
ncbi:helicase-exonuclease AddAB subunit AddA [Natranaerofaba carboxydovora]|uniref:helicase-exonuclease AddAB subunit AddA n=1 Tax=Natranaerofaba carboxydovora TaxID=2742683 RepID=UPI001F144BBB|nr:helicase-exonuclease AddAB subunit AddA [Natranaerofaba carboxydovora]UMZ74075.1 ATP-dependent helicase/nuclease subunit A [Natranaerofaba carboxydovora]